MLLCESIIDEKRDYGSIIKAKKFDYIVNNGPSSIALDANFKLDLIEDIMASEDGLKREMDCCC